MNMSDSVYYIDSSGRLVDVAASVEPMTTDALAALDDWRHDSACACRDAVCPLGDVCPLGEEHCDCWKVHLPAIRAEILKLSVASDANRNAFETEYKSRKKADELYVEAIAECNTLRRSNKALQGEAERHAYNWALEETRAAILKSAIMTAPCPHSQRCGPSGMCEQCQSVDMCWKRKALHDALGGAG